MYKTIEVDTQKMEAVIDGTRYTMDSYEYSVSADTRYWPGEKEPRRGAKHATRTLTVSFPLAVESPHPTFAEQRDWDISVDGGGYKTVMAVGISPMMCPAASVVEINFTELGR